MEAGAGTGRGPFAVLAGHRDDRRVVAERDGLLPGWLGQLEPGDSARGVALVTPPRGKHLDQFETTAAIGEIWLPVRVNAYCRRSFCSVVDDFDPDTAGNGNQGEGHRSACPPRVTVLHRVGHQFAGKQHRRIRAGMSSPENPCGEPSGLAHARGFTGNGQAA